MSHYDIRTGHCLMGFVPSMGRYTLGAADDTVKISDITSQLLTDIGNVKLPSPISIKLEAFIPDAAEPIIRGMISERISRAISESLDLTAPATAANIADTISADFVGQIRPKTIDYVGETVGEIVLTSLQYSLKGIIQSSIIKIAKKIGVKPTDPLIPGYQPPAGSGIPIVPIVAIAAAAALFLIMS